MNGNAIRSVAVAGDGLVGLSAALAFRRALPDTTVVVVRTPPDPAALADRLPAAWPSIGQFHALIGMGEADLLQRGIALHHVGTIFDDWPSGRNWVHGFGQHGKPVGTTHFDKIWMQAQQAGSARPYEDYSAAEVLARAGKFIHPSRNTDSILGRFEYGLRLDPDQYRASLRDQAANSGIRLIDGTIASVQPHDSDRIGALSLSDGERIETDLFIDGSGPRGRLVGELDADFEEWQHGARRLSIDDLAAEAPSPVARVSATESAWTALWPLRDRTMRCVANGAEGVSIRPGRRTRPWAGNVLALGDAAMAIDPLYGLNLALVHRSIFLALELLPGRDFNASVLAEFNRRWLLVTDQVRDLIALLYMGNGAPDAIPQGLARRVDQYIHRGRLPYQEDEFLSRDDWTSALIGLGIVPRNVDPAAAGVPLDQAAAAMNRIADELADFAARAPSYPDYLARMTRG